MVMLWCRRLRTSSTFVAFLASTSRKIPSLASNSLRSLAFCHKSYASRTLWPVKKVIGDVGVSHSLELPRITSVPNFISINRHDRILRNMNSIGKSEEGSVTRIDRMAMAEIIEDVANSSREESGYVIIDVRGHDEVASTGKLHEVVYTLPLPFIVEGALKMDEDDFREAFGFEKPGLDETLVFTCKAGIRSASASKLAQMAGYTDLLDYGGGANEWFS